MTLALSSINHKNVFGQSAERVISGNYRLIAHRGGVVNDSIPENSLASLSEAINRGYYMVEVDVRLSKDGMLITHHDKDFVRYYGNGKLVSEMTWSEIQKLEGENGQKVLQLETVLAACQGKIKVMIDNKIAGYDESAFNVILGLLEKYQLRKGALMIGTDESTSFFTGRIKLSCTRKQIEENKKMASYNPHDYYLFSSKISKSDIVWAKQNDIEVVGAVNAWAIKDQGFMETAKAIIDQMKDAGVSCFQVDSIFDPYFYN
ncbi:glycerophosphodiester phosphodiesterase [Echinicola salinicaeni]|uniref:glycerophosphodiester phosphodiesterase n=1 Tax=Echinicola salinicaeni TaxID=2762757 RepID=UPI0016444213|nr:glycerophosphodiester phosphodiesterase family protein [Echinicola salinicaeni]